MIDRIPTKVLENGAIRYGVYGENGALLRYEYIKPEDEPTQEGTPLNKANLLSDETAALFDIKGDQAVPDKAFAATDARIADIWANALSDTSIYLYTWSRVLYQAEINSKNFTYGFFRFVTGTNTSAAKVWYYADSITANNKTGQLSLVNPKSLTLSYNTYTQASVLAGKYFCTESATTANSIFYFIESVISTTRAAEDGDYIVTISVSQYTTKEYSATVRKTNLSNVSSYDSAAYPDGGFVEDTYYDVISQSASGKIAVIQGGMYVGTGTYGESNPNILGFDKKPKIIIIADVNDGTAVLVQGSLSASTAASSNYYTLYTTWTDNLVSWYGTSTAARQGNVSGKTYRYYMIY